MHWLHFQCRPLSSVIAATSSNHRPVDLESPEVQGERKRRPQAVQTFPWRMELPYPQHPWKPLILQPSTLGTLVLRLLVETDSKWEGISRQASAVQKAERKGVGECKEEVGAPAQAGSAAAGTPASVLPLVLATMCTCISFLKPVNLHMETSALCLPWPSSSPSSTPKSHYWEGTCPPEGDCRPWDPALNTVTPIQPHPHAFT